MSGRGSYIFIGGTRRGLDWLQLAARQSILPSRVYCLQEDDHEVLRASPQIVARCHRQGIPCTLRKRLSREDEQEIAAQEPDLVVVMGWRSLLGDSVLQAPRFGAIGIHESLLPAYRGFAPVNWAVINGETETGVTLFYLTSTGVDDGDIVAQARIEIGEFDTAREVYDRACIASIDLLSRNITALLANEAPRTPQEESAATYTCARTPEDGVIDWSTTTSSIHNLIRGLAHPYPGAISYYDGSRFRIWSGEPVNAPRRFAGRIPGRVVGTSRNVGVEVLTGDGIYRIRTASREGKPVQPAEELFRSIRSGFDFAAPPAANVGQR